MRRFHYLLIIAAFIVECKALRPQPFNQISSSQLKSQFRGIYNNGYKSVSISNDFRGVDELTMNSHNDRINMGLFDGNTKRTLQSAAKNTVSLLKRINPFKRRVLSQKSTESDFEWRNELSMRHILQAGAVAVLPASHAMDSSFLRWLNPLRIWMRRFFDSISSHAPNVESMSPVQLLGLWATLFILQAALHSAESAITKISPWKVQQFADEEGPRSPFSTLSRSEDLTRLLSTIVLTTTACSIYSTALFVTAVSQLLPHLSLGSLTAMLTVISLMFGEVFPKALAVGNSELVTRKV